MVNKKAKPFVIILWLHMVVFSLFLLLDPGTELKKFSKFDKDELVQEITTTSGSIKFRLYKGSEVFVTSQVATLPEKVIYYSKNSTEPDSIVINAAHMKIYTDDDVFKSVKLQKVLSRKVKPVGYINDIPVTHIARSWFSATKIAGIIMLLICLYFLYVYYVEVIKD